MSLHPVVRRAIADRQPPRRRPIKQSNAKVEIVVRLNVDPERVRKIGGREVQINLTPREHFCVMPVDKMLFGNRDHHRVVRLIVNRRRAWLLSVSNTGIIVFTFKKPQVW